MFKLSLGIKFYFLMFIPQTTQLLGKNSNGVETALIYGLNYV